MGVGYLVLEMKLLPQSRKPDHRPDSSRSAELRFGRIRLQLFLCSSMDSSKSTEDTIWQRLLPKSTALWRQPRTREDRGLGAEGWLGLMIFLGIVLGLVYARLTLP